MLDILHQDTWPLGYDAIRLPPIQDICGIWSPVGARNIPAFNPDAGIVLTESFKESLEKGTYPLFFLSIPRSMKRERSFYRISPYVSRLLQTGGLTVRTQGVPGIQALKGFSCLPAILRVFKRILINNPSVLRSREYARLQ